MYSPPFVLTPLIVDAVSKISERVSEIHLSNSVRSHIKLRRENRIKTIHSSLAIENNSLSLEQITAIIDGKRVLGNPFEIKEVQNAIKAYDILMSLNPYSEKDLLKAHKLMMRDLVNESGEYRTTSVGVFNGKDIIHMAPPYERVPHIMADLFEWLKKTDAHPLVKSSVFHYEFEFIHPFQDGNGRIGRLWQTVILKEWKELFAFLPVETLIKENQNKYYEVLKVCDSEASSTLFIEFMLDLILKSIEELIDAQKVTLKVNVKVSVNQQKIMDEVKRNPYITQEELSNIVGISKKSISENMKKLKDRGMLRRIGADKNGYWEIIS